MPPKDKYSDPKLRDEVKQEIHESDKGGAPGQWSARKAQMMAQEYKKRGGGYNTDKSEQDNSQKHLSEWTEEEWQTKEGSGHAKQDDGTEKRYLPKKAWEQMSEKEKEETDEKKQEGSKEGKQYVGNTEKAKESRENANEEEREKYEEKKEREKRQKRNQKQGGEGEDEDDEKDAAEEDGDEEYQEDDGDEEEDDKADDQADGEEGEDDAQAGQKRSRGKQSGSKKSQKDNAGKGQSKGSGQKQNDNSGKSDDTVGSKHQKNEEPAPKGSADRLPKKGQDAHWKALPGFVDGKVEDVLTEEQEVDGKTVKASEKDPKIVLKSNKSGKICVHKPEACFYH